MIDPFGRRISYLRLSVTDRCDLRCHYCMGEDVEFLPRPDVLSLEELARVARAFVRKGIGKIRLTGGEPLVRRNVMALVGELGELVKGGHLDELTLTTNGTRLAHVAEDLARAGIVRINVSLDSLNPATFARITRRGRLEAVLDGIFAARRAGLAIRVNAVVQRGVNDHELDDMVTWCGRHGFDLGLIEEMPIGGSGLGRTAPLPLSTVYDRLAERWTLVPTGHSTGGPAKYVRIAETGIRVGFITPMSDCFCAGCNRVRVTSAGMLHACLGYADGTDLRAPLRASPSDLLLDAAIDAAIARKPREHAFLTRIAFAPDGWHRMNVIGG